MPGRRGWAEGGAVAERQRGSGPAMGRYIRPIAGYPAASQARRSGPLKSRATS